MNKRDVSLALLAGMAGLGLAMQPSAADSAVTGEDANAAIMTWLDALQTGDPAAVEKVLAPEFQILRSDGQGYGKVEYLTVLPKQTSKPEISDLVFSSGGGTLVARYILRIDQTINGKPVQTIAPRLSVFRRTEQGWLIAAHANFARIG
ncbi:MAG: nuclear transport factor 2 family protein [Aestuariivirga sp.]|nr:nuclear transport factor 2 family protein [Aestuariivirga sp.]